MDEKRSYVRTLGGSLTLVSRPAALASLIRFDKEKKKTDVMKKNLNPVFMKQVHFDRMLSTTSKNLVEVVVEDYDLGGNDFMGQVSVPLVTLKDRKEVRRWFKLQNKDGTVDGKDRGEILLAFRWTYDKSAKPPVEKGGLEALEDIKPKRRVSTPPKRERKKTVVKKEVSNAAADGTGET